MGTEDCPDAGGKAQLLSSSSFKIFLISQFSKIFSNRSRSILKIEISEKIAISESLIAIYRLASIHRSIPVLMAHEVIQKSIGNEKYFLEVVFQNRKKNISTENFFTRMDFSRFRWKIFFKLRH